MAGEAAAAAEAAEEAVRAAMAEAAAAAAAAEDASAAEQRAAFDADAAAAAAASTAWQFAASAAAMEEATAAAEAVPPLSPEEEEEWKRAQMETRPEDAAETLRADWPSADVAPPGAEPLRSVRDVRIGQRVRVLSLDIARTAMQSHPCGWTAQMEEFCGELSKVLKKDDGDGTLQLSNHIAGGRAYWFSVGCCVKP